jgi:hypothetical protein
VVDASQEPVVVDASQASLDASQPTQDLFDDLPDEVIASIEEVMETHVQQQKAVKKMKAVKIEKVNDVKIEKPKAVKNKHVGKQVLYHGQKRRSSERIQLNAFKKPITGIGSTDAQPIVTLVQILLINKGFTSVENIPVVKRNMKFLLHLFSILLEVKNT